MDYKEIKKKLVGSGYSLGAKIFFTVAIVVTAPFYYIGKMFKKHNG